MQLQKFTNSLQLNVYIINTHLLVTMALNEASDGNMCIAPLCHHLRSTKIILLHTAVYHYAMEHTVDMIMDAPLITD